jgi:hypothetical protein
VKAHLVNSGDAAEAFAHPLNIQNDLLFHVTLPL